jgi:hypothetical protein
MKNLKNLEGELMKKEKSGQPFWYLLVAAVVVIAAAYLLIPKQTPSGAGGQIPPNQSGASGEKNITHFVEPKVYSPYYEGLEAIVQAELNRTSANATRGDYLPAAMFQELPSFPPDLYQMQVLFKYYQMGKIRNKTDLNNKELGPEYWKQPEWIPTFFTGGLPLIQNPPMDTRYYHWAEYELISANQIRNKNTGEVTTLAPGVVASVLPNKTIEVKTPRVGIEGYTVYPSDMVIADAQPDTYFDVYTVLYCGWYVQTYQGVKLVPAFPDSGAIEDFQLFADGTKVVTQNPSEAEKYFKVEFEPEQFVLEPSFPIFKEGWAKLVRMRITVNESTPKGKYIVGMNIVAPSKEFNEEMLWKYKTQYRVGEVGIGRPFFRVFLQVV